MFHIVTKIVTLTTPKPQFLQNHPWLYVKFSSTASSSRSKVNSFTVSYLIDTCGFSPERAASVSNHLNFETSEKPNSVIEFFKSHGFSQSQALSVIRGFPRLLLADHDKTLKPKIDFFKSVGFSNSEIRKIVTGRPRILGRSLQNEIIPCFDFFYNMFQYKNKLMKTVLRFPGILEDIDIFLVPNMKLLREGGVPESNIIRFIEYFPRTMMASPKKFEEKMQEVKELGFHPSKVNFIVAINVKLCISRSSWARKEGIYRKWGWTDYDICVISRHYPLFMAISDNKIEAMMNFLVNKLCYTPSEILKFPAVLNMSLEKRVIPRGCVILALKSKGLVDELRLHAVYMVNEMTFLDKFVSCHKEEAEELLKLYHAKMALPR